MIQTLVIASLLIVYIPQIVYKAWKAWRHRKAAVLVEDAETRAYLRAFGWMFAAGAGANVFFLWLYVLAPVVIPHDQLAAGEPLWYVLLYVPWVAVNLLELWAVKAACRTTKL